MIYGEMTKEVELRCVALDKYDYKEVSVPIEEDFKTILAYLFKKRFDVAYNEMSWYLEKGAREFVRDLEDKWLHNEIDTFDLYHNDEFLEFYKEFNDIKIELDEDEFIDAFEEFYDDCKDEVAWMSKEELEELKEDYKYGIEVEGEFGDYYRSEDIDIDEFLEELEDDEEDEVDE